MVLAGCAPVMTVNTADENGTELVEAIPDNSEPNAVALDAAPVANVSPLPCVDTDSYDTCLAGKRAMPGKPCFEITAYLEDAVKQRDVHAAPDAGSRVLGRILGVAPGDEGRPATFEVIDSRDGWLLINGAADDPEINGGIDRPMYHGKGWIRGEGVGAGVQAEQGFARPDFASEIVIESNSWLENAMVAVLGCDGSWIRARWRPRGAIEFTYRPEAVVARDPLVLEGWATGICNIMETTCDGLNGNRPKP